MNTSSLLDLFEHRLYSTECFGDTPCVNHAAFVGVDIGTHRQPNQQLVVLRPRQDDQCWVCLPSHLRIFAPTHVPDRHGVVTTPRIPEPRRLDL
jgi:hypothetical protein